MCVISWQTGRLLYAVTDVGDGDALNAGRVHGEGTEVHRQSIHADWETPQYVLYCLPVVFYSAKTSDLMALDSRDCVKINCRLALNRSLKTGYFNAEFDCEFNILCWTYFTSQSLAS